MVIAHISNISDIAVSVTLDEFDDIDGFVPLKNFAWKKKQMHKFKPGDELCLEVNEVDKNMNSIELSKKRITPEQASICYGRYRVMKKFFSLVNDIYVLYMEHYKKRFLEDDEKEMLMKASVWNFISSMDFDTINLDRFNLLMSNIAKFYDTPLLDDDFKAVLDESFKNRISLEPYLLEMRFKFQTHKDDGLERIKEILGGQGITCVAPPLYRIEISGNNKTQLLAELGLVDEGIKKRIGENPAHISYMVVEQGKVINDITVNYKQLKNID